MALNTADLFDAHGERCQSCETPFRQFGGQRRFSGRIRTIACRGDNLLIKQTLATPSSGEVLVVDGGGSLASALMGDLIAASAHRNGWSGVVIFGAVRDSVALTGLDLGIKALGTNPRKSLKTGAGTADGGVTFGGVTFTPGHWLYSDDDGILVAEKALV